MTALNGRKMAVGDIVFDVVKGSGRVTDNGNGVLNVTVDFGINGQMRFSQDGKFQGHQRLYWKPPVIIQARGPNDEAFDEAVKLLKMIYGVLVAYETKKQIS